MFTNQTYPLCYCGAAVEPGFIRICVGKFEDGPVQSLLTFLHCSTFVTQQGASEKKIIQTNSVDEDNEM